MPLEQRRVRCSLSCLLWQSQDGGYQQHLALTTIFHFLENVWIGIFSLGYIWISLDLGLWKLLILLCCRIFLKIFREILCVLFYTIDWNINTNIVALKTWLKIDFPEQLFKEFLRWCTRIIMRILSLKLFTRVWNKNISYWYQYGPDTSQFMLEIHTNLKP